MANVAPEVVLPAKLPGFILDNYYQKSRGWKAEVTVTTQLGDSYNAKLIQKNPEKWQKLNQDFKAVK